MDPFEAFESVQNQEDPAAEFLAREQAELDKIENNEDFLSLDGTNESAGDQLFSTNQSSNNEMPTDAYAAVFKADKLAQEPEKIKRWREEQKLRISTKDAEEEKVKQQWRDVAKKDLDEWFKQRKEQLAKTHADNKYFAFF
jgi:hypothetical protein